MEKVKKKKDGMLKISEHTGRQEEKTWSKWKKLIIQREEVEMNWSYNKKEKNKDEV